MPNINLNPMGRVPTMNSAQARPIPVMPGMAEVQRHEVPRNVPTPAQAIAPTQEAVEENEIPQSVASEGSYIRDSFEYENDLTEMQLREFTSVLREKLSAKTWSANLVAQVLGLTHTRITRHFPKGTKLSEILANRPGKREINVDKLLKRMNDDQKRALVAKLQNDLLGVDDDDNEE